MLNHIQLRATPLQIFLIQLIIPHHNIHPLRNSVITRLLNWQDILLALGARQLTRQRYAARDISRRPIIRALQCPITTFAVRHVALGCTLGAVCVHGV